jgi:hypothetical protein
VIGGTGWLNSKEMVVRLNRLPMDASSPVIMFQPKEYAYHILVIDITDSIQLKGSVKVLIFGLITICNV